MSASALPCACMKTKQQASPRGHTCCSLDDVEDARAVAYDLGMPYYVLNFTEEFDEKVIRKFVQVYQNGGTPTPALIATAT